jgi:hypothetical protein
MIGLVLALVFTSWQKPEIDPRASRLPPGIHPKFYQPGSHLDFADPLLLVQAANELIPKGEKRVLAYARDWEQRIESADFNMELLWPYLLVRVLFVGKKPDYIFPHYLGQIPDAVTESPQNWPTYPVLIHENSTILCFPWSFMLGGQMPLFREYIDANSSNWKIRPSKYVLPNDPFLITSKLLELGAAPEDAKATHATIVKQVLKLVRTAYRPSKPGQGQRAENDPKLFEQLHQEFLKAGCHWDSKLSLYVRKDGSFDKDPIEEFSAKEYKFPPLKNLKVVLHFDRQERETCGYSADVSETYGSVIPTAVLEAIDVKTKKQLDWIHINSPSFVLPGDTTIEKMLAEPRHRAVPELRRTPSTMKLFVDQKVQFVLHYDGKTYTSPELNP